MPKRTPLKLPSIMRLGTSQKSCDGCKELLSVVNNLKDRCYELHDECGANQDLVTVLRQGLVNAKNQLDALLVFYHLFIQRKQNFPWFQKRAARKVGFRRTDPIYSRQGKQIDERAIAKRWITTTIGKHADDVQVCNFWKKLLCAA